MPQDFGVDGGRIKDDIELPIAPVDRIARIDIDGRYRVAMDARVALADILEAYADDVAAAAATLARATPNGGPSKAEDVETYYELRQYY